MVNNSIQWFPGVTGLLGYWVTGLLGYWVTGLLGYWVTGLLGYWVTGLFSLNLQNKQTKIVLLLIPP